MPARNDTSHIKRNRIDFQVQKREAPIIPYPDRGIIRHTLFVHTFASPCFIFSICAGLCQFMQCWPLLQRPHNMQNTAVQLLACESLMLFTTTVFNQTEGVLLHRVLEMTFAHEGYSLVYVSFQIV